MSKGLGMRLRFYKAVRLRHVLGRGVKLPEERFWIFGAALHDHDFTQRKGAEHPGRKSSRAPLGQRK